MEDCRHLVDVAHAEERRPGQGREIQIGAVRVEIEGKTARAARSGDPTVDRGPRRRGKSIEMRDFR
jgi:hypothetical protein